MFNFPFLLDVIADCVILNNVCEINKDICIEEWFDYEVTRHVENTRAMCGNFDGQIGDAKNIGKVIAECLFQWTFEASKLSIILMKCSFSWTLLYVLMIEIWLNRFQNAISKYIFHKLKANFLRQCVISQSTYHTPTWTDGQADSFIPHNCVLENGWQGFNLKMVLKRTSSKLFNMLNYCLWSSNGPMSLIITRNVGPIGLRTYDHHLLDGTLAGPLIHTH